MAPPSGFMHEIRAARFLYLDRFFMLASGSKVFMYKYLITPYVEKVIKKPLNP